MALLSVNAAEGENGHCAAGPEPLEAALARVPHGRPVIIMIHGFRFSPHDMRTDPHTHILSFAPRRRCWKAVSWPRHLHLDRPGAGLGIGFGWHARGALPAVAARAHDAGRNLSRLLWAIHETRPDLPLQIIAHSLGARVALTALRGAPDGAVRRLVLISGAEYLDAAREALAAPGGSRCEVLNVTSDENAPFDVVFRLGVAPGRFSDRPLSAGLPDLARWTDLPIDTGLSRRALAALGHRIRPPATRFCHWSGYMRPGLFGVYRRVLDPSDAAFLHALKGALQGAPGCALRHGAGSAAPARA